MSGKLVYDAFISYSHAKDRPIAAALQSAVQKLGKPWYRRRALRVFRDDTSLSATPQLWPSIEQALSRSRFLTLLASPEAAGSPWVDKEVAWWLAHNSADTVLIALTDGAVEWDSAAGDFSWGEAGPLPPALRGHFTVEPRWIDLRPYREGASPRDLRFAELAADFAAAIHGVPKEDLLARGDGNSTKPCGLQFPGSPRWRSFWASRHGWGRLPRRRKEKCRFSATGLNRPSFRRLTRSWNSRRPTEMPKLHLGL